MSDKSNEGRSKHQVSDVNVKCHSSWLIDSITVFAPSFPKHLFLSVKIKLHPVTCRRRAKSRQSLTLPTPDSEHAFQQLLQSLFQCHVLVHFRRALGTRGVAHHRRLSMKRNSRTRADSSPFVSPLPSISEEKRFSRHVPHRAEGRRTGVVAINSRMGSRVYTENGGFAKTVPRASGLVECDSAPWPTDCQPKAPSSSRRPTGPLNAGTIMRSRGLRAAAALLRRLRARTQITSPLTSSSFSATDEPDFTSRSTAARVDYI